MCNVCAFLNSQLLVFNRHKVPKFAVFDFDVANLRQRFPFANSITWFGPNTDPYLVIWMHVVSSILHTISLFWTHYIRVRVLNVELTRISSQLTLITQKRIRLPLVH